MGASMRDGTRAGDVLCWDWEGALEEERALLEAEAGGDESRGTETWEDEEGAEVAGAAGSAMPSARSHTAASLTSQSLVKSAALIERGSTPGNISRRSLVASSLDAMATDFYDDKVE